MNPELSMLPTNWPDLAAFAVLVGSGLLLLFKAYYKAGEKDRHLTARLNGLAPDRERAELPDVRPMREMTPLYRDEESTVGERKKRMRRLLAVVLSVLLVAVAIFLAHREYPFLTLIAGGGAVAAAVGLYGFYRYRRRHLRQCFIEQLPEAIDIIIRGARVGMSLQENFQVVAREMPDPLGRQFRILAEKLSIGIELETALEAAIEEIGVKELQFMATTLVLQRRTGGQYAEVLENLAKLLRDRRAQYLKARALTSEARMSARIVTAVTGVILIILALTNRAQFDFLFDDPLGHNLLIYSGASILIGFFLISHLLRTLQ